METVYKPTKRSDTMNSNKQNKTTGTGCPCDTCVPSPMLGRSWWKCLGFNSPVGNCAEALYEAGFRYHEWYTPEVSA